MDFNIKFFGSHISMESIIQFYIIILLFLLEVICCRTNNEVIFFFCNTNLVSTYSSLYILILQT